MKVICRVSRGYNLKEGETYEVVKFIPQLITPNFTFPRYVVVVDDNGKQAQGHAYRFNMPDGQSCEDYIKDNIDDTIDNN